MYDKKKVPNKHKKPTNPPLHVGVYVFDNDGNLYTEKVYWYRHNRFTTYPAQYNFVREKKKRPPLKVGDIVHIPRNKNGGTYGVAVAIMLESESPRDNLLKEVGMTVALSKKMIPKGVVKTGVDGLPVFNIVHTSVAKGDDSDKQSQS